MDNSPQLFSLIVENANREFEQLLNDDENFALEWKNTPSDFAEWFTDLYLEPLLINHKLK